MFGSVQPWVSVAWANTPWSVVLAVIITAWNAVFHPPAYNETEYVLVFGDQTYAIKEYKLSRIVFTICFTISYLGTYGIRRLLHNRALRRRESSE